MLNINKNIIKVEQNVKNNNLRISTSTNNDSQYKRIDLDDLNILNISTKTINTNSIQDDDEEEYIL
jgi:hypothetical protein